MACQLELKGLVKDYKNFRAVNNVSIEIQKGEIVSLFTTKRLRKDNNLKNDSRSADAYRRKGFSCGRRHHGQASVQKRRGNGFPELCSFSSYDGL